MHSLCTLSLRTKRDVLIARQKARHVAAWLHFAVHDQACIAAGTFAIAAQVLRQNRRGELCLGIEDKRLHIFTRAATSAAPQPGPKGDAQRTGSLRLIKPLPVQAAELSLADMSWLLEQPNAKAAFNMFEEMEHQNEEMLALLHALHAAQDLTREPAPAATTPAAA